MVPLAPFVSSVARSPSKSFAAAMVCFVLGVLVAPAVVSILSPAFLLVAFFVAVFVATMARGHQNRLLFLLVGLFVFGVWRYGQALLPSNVSTIADAAGRSVRISGTVTSEVLERIDGQQAVLDHLVVADAPAEGRLLVRLDAYPPVSYADRLTFNCKPELPEPIESFAYDRYLRSQGILAVCSFPQYVDAVTPTSFHALGALLSFKRVVVARLCLIFPEPHASFLSGLLFGGSSALSSGLKDDFSKTGTSHILAASGFNVSLFSLVFLTWVTHTVLGRRRGVWLTAGLLVTYVLVAGATAAVVRAGIMGVVVLVGFAARRKPSVTNVLLLALAAMLLWNPLLLLDDVGFQLSFVATAAMLWLSGPLERRCTFVPETFELRKSFAGSLAAIVATFPLMVWHFGSVSLVSPIVNLLVLPFVPLLMALACVALVAGFLSPTLGGLVGLPAWAISSVVLHLVTWFGAV